MIAGAAPWASSGAADCSRRLDREQQSWLIPWSQDTASLPNSSPYAARATMTDMCKLQLERGALVLRGFDDLLRLAGGCCTSQDAARRLERDGAHAHLTLLSKNDTRTAAAALARENGDSAPSTDEVPRPERFALERLLRRSARVT